MKQKLFVITLAVLVLTLPVFGDQQYRYGTQRLLINEPNHMGGGAHDTHNHNLPLNAGGDPNIFLPFTWGLERIIEADCPINDAIEVEYGNISLADFNALEPYVIGFNRNSSWNERYNIGGTGVTHIQAYYGPLNTWDPCTFSNSLKQERDMVMFGRTEYENYWMWIVSPYNTLSPDGNPPSPGNAYHPIKDNSSYSCMNSAYQTVTEYYWWNDIYAVSGTRFDGINSGGGAAHRWDQYPNPTTTVYSEPLYFINWHVRGSDAQVEKLGFVLLNTGRKNDATGEAIPGTPDANGGIVCNVIATFDDDTTAVYDVCEPYMNDAFVGIDAIVEGAEYIKHLEINYDPCWTIFPHRYMGLDELAFVLGPHPTDIDLDGDSDLVDLAIFCDSWMWSGPKKDLPWNPYP